MKKIIILVTMLFTMLQSVAMAAGQVKVMQIIRAPIMAWGNAQKAAAYFDGSFKAMFKGKGVELMDRQKTNQVGRVYCEDNRIKDINNDDCAKIGQRAGADYVLFVAYSLNNLRQGTVFSPSPTMTGTASIRLISVKDGQLKIMEAQDFDGKKSEARDAYTTVERKFTRDIRGFEL
ncbi:hypothetical protein [uncultured Acidaminococcus sp.]|uniref:hypothetical protein n=1 Tax=uncultured Acidaminococcus sp. TaxID=352152 RepID=UPI00261BAA4E|nr:hypothetical protein [uncultured Acidaminococcus sp.]